MIQRLTKRFIVPNLNDLTIKLSSPIRYERYYINDNVRIQKRGTIYQKEVLECSSNSILEKAEISKQEFCNLKQLATQSIARDSYLVLGYPNISIKEYKDKYKGLIRAEVSFDTIDEMNNYQKPTWMGIEITQTPLAFDTGLNKLSRKQFLRELKKVA